MEYKPNVFTVYTKSNCPYCSKVKELLNQNKQIVEYIDCDDELKESKTKEAFLKCIEGRIGYEYRTFPMVFLDGIFVGGYAQTAKYFENQLSECYFTMNF